MLRIKWNENVKKNRFRAHFRQKWIDLHKNQDNNNLRLISRTSSTKIHFSIFCRCNFMSYAFQLLNT